MQVNYNGVFFTGTPVHKNTPSKIKMISAFNIPFEKFKFEQMEFSFFSSEDLEFWFETEIASKI